MTSLIKSNLIIFLATTYAAFHRESNAVKEICTMIRRGIFCIHKTGFLMPGHMYSIRILLDNSYPMRSLCSYLLTNFNKHAMILMQESIFSLFNVYTYSHMHAMIIIIIQACIYIASYCA